MSWDLVLRHCATLKAATALLTSQIDALAAYVEREKRRDAPKAEMSRPETCNRYKAEDCARLSDEAAIELGGMGSSQRTVMCRGCGETIPLG